MYITEYIFGGQNTHFSLVYTQVELLDYKILNRFISNRYQQLFQEERHICSSTSNA